MNALRNTVLTGWAGLGKFVKLPYSPKRKILACFVTSVVTVSFLRRIIKMDKFTDQIKTVLNAASKAGDELKGYELPDLERLGREISEETVKLIDNAISDLKKKIGEVKKKSKHATNQTEKEVLDFAIQKMEDALRTLKHLRKDVQRELKKSKKK